MRDRDNKGMGFVNTGKFHLCLALVLLTRGLLLVPTNAGADSAPVVSNVQATQRPGTFIVDITYDLADPDGDASYVTLYFSPDGGTSWPSRCISATGAANNLVEPGTGHSVAWDAGADFPDLISDSCTIRVMAVDHDFRPRIEALWKTDLDGQEPIPLAYNDTIAFGEPFRLNWQGNAPYVMDMDPLLLASLDTVYPHDDGLLGYKYDLLIGDCIPDLEDCWSPRYFDEATGDSVSYFGNFNSLDFHNDGSGPGPFHELLPSGTLQFKLNTLDVAGLEIREHQQDQALVINFDPETIVLNGETDWAHPEDPEVYPYYVLLNDPLQIHHPFQDGERIPDRTYVVVKALGRDDARDLRVDPDDQVAITGYLRGVRDNLQGGQFTFETESSVLSPPSWPATCDTCFSADTLGFLIGPRSTFTINMQAVDEHGRKDGTPAKLDFDVGYPPCIQCIEILPKSSLPSSFDETLECLVNTEPGTIAAHPCFGDTTVLRISEFGSGDDDLEYVRPAYMLVDKITGETQVVDEGGQGGVDNFEIEVNIYRLLVLLHGSDDYRERWLDPISRSLAWSYQVDYDCDPFNQIQDGGGVDDINSQSWGETPGVGGLEIDPASGLWRLLIEVAVPRNLMLLGPDLYRDLALRYIVGIEDPEIRDRVFADSTRQLGPGRVQAIALDQTRCDFLPLRPARYNIFRQVRPSVANLPAGLTWRDCNLEQVVPGIMMGLDLWPGSMESLTGQPVSNYFQIVVETATGDFDCVAR
jgi:hypothetical protein